ncbi:MAG: copper chaperone [Trizodia sp. TS-e1964]|nr:MAG: copper chaperone [Trizodia sp. TS-e1964]
MSAAVCILETHCFGSPNKVRGLARIVQVSPSLTLVDLTINGVSPGQYWATVRETGDISDGPASTGNAWDFRGAEHQDPLLSKGILGSVVVGQDGKGSMFLDRPIQCWEIIGRSMAISKQREGRLEKEDPDVLVGVIARSAGVWDNDKTVCSCSGKSMWDERKENKARGIL